MKRLLSSVVLMFPFLVIALLTFNVRLALTAESQNMELVGTNDLQARSAYQPIIQRQGNRWILYAGHHALGTNPVTGAPLPSFNPLTGVNEPNGVSIVDVTNPAAPVYLKHLPVGTTGNWRCADAARMPWRDAARSATPSFTCSGPTLTLPTKYGT